MGDGSNCGVFTLACAEDRINATQYSRPFNPFQLRQHYFRLLINSSVRAEGSTSADLSSRRKRQDSGSSGPNKCLCTSIQIPPDSNKKELAEVKMERLKAFGDKWAQFYKDHSSKGYNANDVYWILNLAAMPACGPVMAQVAEALEDCSVDEAVPGQSMAVQIFRKGEKLSAKGELLQRVSSTTVYEDFWSSLNYHQRRLKKGHDERQKRAARKLKVTSFTRRNAHAYAMDDLLLKHMNITLPQEGSAREGMFNKERSLLTRAKRKGKLMKDVNDLLRQENVETPSGEYLQYLLPLQRTSSQLDGNLWIDLDE